MHEWVIGLPRGDDIDIPGRVERGVECVGEGILVCPTGKCFPRQVVIKISLSATTIEISRYWQAAVPIVGFSQAVGDSDLVQNTIRRNALGCGSAIGTPE